MPNEPTDPTPLPPPDPGELGALLPGLLQQAMATLPPGARPDWAVAGATLRAVQQAYTARGLVPDSELLWQLFNGVCRMAGAQDASDWLALKDTPEITDVLPARVRLRWGQAAIDQALGRPQEDPDDPWAVTGLTMEVRPGGITLGILGPDDRLLFQQDKPPFPTLATTYKQAMATHPGLAEKTRRLATRLAAAAPQPLSVPPPDEILAAEADVWE